MQSNAGDGLIMNKYFSSMESPGVQEEFTNGDDMDDSFAKVDDDMDPDIKIKGLQLELQRLEVQEQRVLLRQQLFQLEAAKKKNITQSATNRCILPDGRIVVRNVNDRGTESREVEGSFAAGAGDSLTIPALQRGATCVSCGGPSDSFCSRCGLTPYCSPRCQRRDWAERHRAVCHNLARMAGKPDAPTPENNNLEKDIVPPAAPLRRPRSPAAKPQRRDDDVPDQTGPKKYPPTQNNNNKQQGNRNFPHGPRNFNNTSTNNNKYKTGDRDRRQPRRDSGDEEENWGDKPAATPAPITSQPTPHQPPTDSARQPRPQPKPEPVAEPPRPAAEPPRPVAEPPRPVAAEAPRPAVKAPGSVADATPAKSTKKLVPSSYLIEHLSLGDTVLLSVESAGSDSRAPRGFVCLAMHEKFEKEYQDLCEQYTVDCEAETNTITPAIGESFSYLNPSDGGWYRCRRVSASLAAMLDAGRLQPLAATPKPLPGRYSDMPEFCCLLDTTGVQVGDNLKCKLISKTEDVYKVSLEHVETGAPAGEGEVSRWVPTVEYPAAAPAPPAAATIQPQIPEVRRPDVTNNSRVLLVDATAYERAFVRPTDAASQRRFDQILEDVVMYAGNAAPLKEPPQKGQVVIGKFSDGLFYRALCKRTNVKQNKYLLEYIEFGNVEITALENIYACPPSLDLATRPTEASLVALQGQCAAFTSPAMDYLDGLKDNLAELLLTLPSGASSAASGSSVCLTEVKTNESLNRKLQQMCTPEWKKLEERGGDVVDVEHIMFSDIECVEIPPDGGELVILDFATLPTGILSGCPKGTPYMNKILKTLMDQMAEYCNSALGKEPYLPKHEEMCITQCPLYGNQWYRAAMLKQLSPGSETVRVCYVDFGNVGEVPARLLRKMLPEFVRGLPALASTLEIVDFPNPPTSEMLTRAADHLRINEEGHGTLHVTKCEKVTSGNYRVHAPQLIKAMMNA